LRVGSLDRSPCRQLSPLRNQLHNRARVCHVFFVCIVVFTPEYVERVIALGRVIVKDCSVIAASRARGDAAEAQVELAAVTQVGELGMGDLLASWEEELLSAVTGERRLVLLAGRLQ